MYQVAAGYARVRGADGRWKLGRAIMKDQYRCTGVVRDTDFEALVRAMPDWEED